METRSYQGLHDLKAMLDLLSEGRRANNGTYYVHRGDLQWWLFYTDLPPERWQSRIRLWMEDDRLVGWALLSPEEHAFDVFVAPQVRGDSREHEMLAWAVNEMTLLDEIDTLWVAENDEARIRWFEENGFVCGEDHFVHLQRSLSGPLDGPPVPKGFSLRTSRGDEEEARLRSVASHAAFKSGKPFEEYWPRTSKFNQSPVYVPEHELFVMSPDGEVAAFCILWTDELNRLGHFEPVGTHPDFQRRGLGKCLLFEALGRLKAEGMNEADVCADHDNPAAIGLYESVGFRKSKRLLTYKKKDHMNQTLETQSILPLPAGYSARGGKLEDYEITFDLLNIYARHLHDRDDLVDPEVLRLDWLNDGFTPEADLRMIFAPDGSLVAFIECWLNLEPPVHPWIYGCVHPDHWGMGIGGHILTWAEDHARPALEKCAQDLRVAPRSGTEAHNETGIALFEHMGWKHIRSYYRMVTDLDSTPDVPSFPDGITVRLFDPETETEVIYRTVLDTFKDHFGFIVPPFEKGLADFKHNFIEDPGYDPRFWFVALDGHEMVGMCICRREDIEDPESGWVSELGVRRAWRNRGLGYGLLKHAFAAFHADGKKRACLGVDADSLTGALKIYERAGMRVLRQFNQYEKEMRPGRELAVESL